MIRRLTALCLLGCAVPAHATVHREEAELPAPTVVVLQQAEAAALGGRVRAGDFRMEYGTVAFLIGQPGRTTDLADAGAILDVLQLFPAQRRLGLERLGLILDGVPARQPIYTRAITSRSRDLAAVRLEGYDPDEPAVSVSTEYQMGQQLRIGDGLRIVTTVQNVGQRTLPHYRIGDAIRFGGLGRFAPGSGFLPPSAAAALPYLLGLSAGGALLYVPGGAGARVSGLHGPRASYVSDAGEDLGPRRSATYARTLLLSPGPEPYRALCSGPAPLVDGNPRPIVGRVKEERSGAGLGASVVLERTGGEAVVAVSTAADGRFSLCAPGPGDYRLRAEAPGRAALGIPSIRLGPGPAGPPELTLTLSRLGRLRVSLRDLDAGRHGAHPSPGRLAIVPLDPALQRAGDVISASVPLQRGAGRTSVLLPAAETELMLPPGHYRLVGSHGLLYDLGAQELSLQAGETRRLGLPLRRALPQSETGALQCTLLRVIPVAELGVALLRAEGLSPLLLPGGLVPRDARFHADLGLVPAAEVGTASRGRVTLYPLADPARLPDLRQVPSAGALLHALAAAPLADLSGDRQPPLVQLAPAGGSALPSSALPFDAWELWTGPDPTPVPERLRDYLGRVSTGLRAAAVGGADPLDEDQGLFAPRTCFGAVESARPLSAARELTTAVRGGGLQVTNGPLLRVTANGAGPGELAAAPDGKVTVEVAVLGAPWVDITEVLVLTSGGRTLRAPVPPGRVPLRYHGRLTLTIERDEALVVLARGERPLELFPGQKPLAFANPIFIDRDGDGRFAGAPPPSSRAPKTNRGR